MFVLSSQTITCLLVWISTTVHSSFLKLGSEEIQIINTYCGISKTPRAHFKVLGPDAGPNDFPWAALLWIKHDVTVEYKDGKREPHPDQISECSGTLISTRHVITAAHCFFNVLLKEDQHGHMISSYTGVKTPLVYRVGLGGLTENKQNKNHVKMYLPNDQVLATQDPTKLEFEHGLDYALVELAKNITEDQMKSGGIVPVCMTKNSGHLAFEKLFTLAGFGTTEDEEYATLRYSKDIEETECGIPTNIPVGCPICKCFQKSQATPVISQDDDSGAGYYVYDDSVSPRKAYLYAVHISTVEYKEKQGSKKKNVMAAMGLVDTNPSQVIDFVQHNIGLSFSSSN